MVKLFFKILILLVLSSAVFAQETPKIKKTQKQLSELRSEIKKLQDELDSKSKREKESIESLEKINKQNSLLSKLIHKLKQEELSKKSEVAKLVNQMNDIQSKIKALKDDYSVYVVWVYKNRQKSKLDYLFNASSVREALNRYKYLEAVTRNNELKLERLNDTQKELETLASKVEREKQNKHRLASEKAREQSKLKSKKKEKKNLISVLKKDQKNIEQEISNKKNNEIEIRNIITKLIEEEKRRLASIRTKRLKNKNVKIPDRFNYSSLENFSALRGKLKWPLKGGKVVRKFGENKNTKLNTVTQNYGIDIKAGKYTDVNVVAEGFVSAIRWIPGYGTVVIVAHRDEYRTVYGHITDVQVEEGQRLSRGQKLGKVNTSLEGKLLHFEVWNDRNYKNPERWLSRK
ncbi:MAG: murein hydrolase activator EnvC [Rhodothermaceae bacterium]